VSPFGIDPTNTVAQRLVVTTARAAPSQDLVLAVPHSQQRTVVRAALDPLAVMIPTEFVITPALSNCFVCASCARRYGQAMTLEAGRR